MELTRTRFAFVWWWIWLIAVTTASVWMYLELRDIFSPVFKGYSMSASVIHYLAR